MKLSAILMATLAFTSLDAAAADAVIDPAPVNTEACDAAVKLYELLLANYGQRVITGAVAEDARDFQNAEYIKNITGHYPVINCSDYIQHNQAAPVNPSGWSSKRYSDPSADADWAAKGGIVSYQWHWRTPSTESNINNFSNDNYGFYCNGAGGSYEKDSNFSLKNAMDNANSWERRVIDRDLDAIGGYLKNMQDRGVAVLWRPLHEAAGNYDRGWGAWFWWGNSGPEAMKWLWRYMFDRFHDQGINNLLWVWTSTGNIDTNWYPGDDYVDIIGLDYYENNASKYRNSLSWHYNELRKISSHKMLALTECGAVPSIDNMKQGGDMWSYAIPWNGNYTRDGKYNSAESFRAFYSSPLAAHRDNIGDGVDPTPNPPVPPVSGDGTVLWENESNPALMDWSNIVIRVSADRARKIMAGDRLVATVTRINSEGWPKVVYSCEDGWVDIHQDDVYPDRGQAMPKDYTFSVASSDLALLHKGFMLRGENCYVSRLTHIGQNSSLEIPGADSASAPVNVYSMQGVLLRRGVARAEATAGLAPGLYIVGTEKVCVK